ncbi:TolC family protein [Haloferula chungangensis]|uniref:TolC family protein n=1 Tax=Haloferula chungangensis TaxID=1048331 RepID=A0ABW2LC10_9BACT
MYFYRIAVFTACLAFTFPAAAEPGAVVTLGSIGDRVRSQNPDLKAARFTIQEAAGRLRQSGRLENPQLEVGLEHNTKFREGLFEMGVSQRFPVTNRLKLEKNLGATSVQAAQTEVREITNQLIGDAKAALVRVLAVRQRKELLKQQADLANELADFIAEVAKKGEASSLDAGQAKLEASRFLTQSRQLAAAEQQAIGELKPLLGMFPGETLHVSGSLPSLRVPEGADEVERPALEMARLAVIAAEQETAIERTKRYGDVEAGVYAGAERSIDEPEGSEVDGIIGVRFKIPLPFWDKNEGNIDAAEAKAERRRQEVIALNQGIRLEAEAARAEMLEWANLAKEIEMTLSPQAAEQTDLAEQAWRNGQGDLLAVLRSQEQRLELAAARLEALENFQLARVRYQTALGNP